VVSSKLNAAMFCNEGPVFVSRTSNVPVEPGAPVTDSIERMMSPLAGTESSSTALAKTAGATVLINLVLISLHIVFI
jgi:hypothetical protein